MKRRTGRVVVSAVTATMAAVWMSGCSAPYDQTDADYVRVCKDPQTGKRVDDSQCRDGSSGGGGYIPHWYYLPIGGSGRTTVPGVGQSVPSSGTASQPSGAKVTTAKPAGGSYAKPGGVSRGGFGGSNKGSGS